MCMGVGRPSADRNIETLCASSASARSNDSSVFEIDEASAAAAGPGGVELVPAGPFGANAGARPGLGAAAAAAAAGALALLVLMG